MYNGPQRKYLRRKDYNYSQDGVYFITFCSYKKQCVFGEIVDSKMILNEYGKIVEKCWLSIMEHFDDVTLDGFVLMPNHVHGVLHIVGTADLLSLQELNAQDRTKMLLSKVIHT